MKRARPRIPALRRQRSKVRILSGPPASRPFLRPERSANVGQSHQAAEPLRLERRSMSNPAFKFDHVHIISENPRASAEWYVEMFGATIAADTVARGAPQIFVDLGSMTILIRGRRPGEEPAPARPIRP